MESTGLKERQAHKLTSAGLWKHFISKRQPVKIKGPLQDPDWHASERWTHDYLIKEAGHASVMVEQRPASGGSFGRGVKTRMSFGAFVKRAAAGDTSLYLSTQEATVAPDGHPHLLTEPLASLAGDYPLRPGLMGNLVPQAINMWMGVAADGASSGLHHDFHDNLYVLLRGSKRFRLYPPSQVPNMYTHGTVAWTHPNGRIVYKGQGDVLADGTDAREVQQWRERTQAETAVAAAEAAVAQGVKGARKQLAAAERQLEALLEGALDGDDFGDMHDEFADGDDSDDDEHAGQRKRRKASSDAAPPRKRHKKSADAAVAGDAGANRAAPGEPPNFSRVDLSGAATDKELRGRWPLFPGRKAAITVSLQAGEMLYLPAGWFHEVTSIGSTDEGGHLAVNYWFHPPDNLDSSQAGFNTPYTSEYLPSMWAARQAWLAREAATTQQARAKRAGHGAYGVANGGGLAKLKVGKRKVEWREDVSTPPNKYRQSMTKEGTASGDVGVVPVLEKDQEEEEDGLVPMDGLDVLHAGLGDKAHAGSEDTGKEDSQDAAEGLQGLQQEGGPEDGDAAGPDDPQDMESARAAVSEWMQSQPNLAKLLFAQFLQAGGAQVLADGGGREPLLGDPAGMGGLQRVAVRVPAPPRGRRHHLVVTMKQVPRRKAPR